MRRELEIRQELKQVRKLLTQYRANGWNDDMLYGAQQALIWMLEQGQSPSNLETAILKVAINLESEDGTA